MAPEFQGFRPDDKQPPIEITLTPDHVAGQPQEPFTFTIIPEPEIGKALNRDEDGGITIFTRGKIQSGGQEVIGEVAITIPPPVTESSVADEMPVRSTPIPKKDSKAVTEQSEEVGGTEEKEPTIIFTGAIGFVGSLRKRKSGKRIIDFSLRTTSDEGETENHQIRAFDGLASFVSRNVRKNQSGVQVEAYPDKILPTWERDTKTRQWKKTERAGYIAKKVKVPKRSEGKQPKGTT